MSVDASGKWWKGSEPEDIKEFLDAYSSDAYPTKEFRLCRCGCGSVTFHLEASDNEGVARRTCTKCRLEHFLLDSEEFWEEAETEMWQCTECKRTEANVGVGYAFYDDGGIRWVYIGERCAHCHVLGCFAGWKIDYDPSIHLLEQA